MRKLILFVASNYSSLPLSRSLFHQINNFVRKFLWIPVQRKKKKKKKRKQTGTTDINTFIIYFRFIVRARFNRHHHTKWKKISGIKNALQQWALSGVEKRAWIGCAIKKRFFFIYSLIRKKWKYTYLNGRKIVDVIFKLKFYFLCCSYMHMVTYVPPPKPTSTVHNTNHCLMHDKRIQ